MKPRKFTVSEGADIISWFDKFERIARNNAWNEERHVRTIPLYLNKSALIFYSNLPAATRDNQELVNEAPRRQYQNDYRQSRLR